MNFHDAFLENKKYPSIIEPIKLHEDIDILSSLSRFDKQGLKNIRNKNFRQHIRSIIESGCLHQAAQLLQAHALADGQNIPPYILRPRCDHIYALSDRLASELRDYGLACSTDLVRNMACMRAMMVPLEDEEVAFALTRTWVVGPLLDDLCESSSENSLAMLRIATGMNDCSAFSKYCNFMFSELERFSSPEFIPLFRMMFYKSFMGTLFESQIKRTTFHRKPALDYIRNYNGFCEYWFISAQFIDKSIRYQTHPTFWIDIIPDCVSFLNDLNDLISIYKEAVDGKSFAYSRLHLSALSTGRPLIDVYRDTLRSGIESFNYIIQASSKHGAGARTIIINYMQGYICWLFFSSRYRWRDLFPELRYLL